MSKKPNTDIERGPMDQGAANEVDHGGEVSRAPISRQRQALYFERKAAGLCTRCGDTAAEDKQLCAKHHARSLVTNKATKNRRRKERRARGLCAHCGRPSEKYRCLLCDISWGLVRMGGSHGVTRQDQMRSDYVEGDGYRRTRYHGQGHRGAPSMAVLDGQELAYATKELAKGYEGQQAATGLAKTGMGKVELRQVEMAWLDRVSLAVRFLTELLERHRYEERSQAAMDKRRQSAEREQQAKIKEALKMRERVGGK